MVDTKALVEKSKVEPITDQELEDLRAWAKVASDDDLITFVTEWTKGTQPSKMFGANFKKINPILMEYVLPIFSDPVRADAQMNRQVRMLKDG